MSPSQISDSAIDAIFDAGVAAHRRQSLGLAERLYRDVLCLAPDHADALNNLGVLLERTGRPDEAERSYRLALRARPDHVDALCNLGLLLHAAQRLDEARSCYEDALALRPDCASAHIQLGVLMQLAGRWPESEPHFRAVLASDGGAVQAWAHLGVTLYRTGRIAQAERAYRRALELNPACAEAANNLGVLLQKHGREAQAESHFRQALAGKPDYRDARSNLAGLLWTRQQYREAEHCYRALLADKLDCVDTLTALGGVLRDAHQFLEAERVLRQALELEPDRLPAAFNLSLVLLSLGRFEEGWRLHESRHGDSPHWGSEAGYHDRPLMRFPDWQGESLAGKSMTVWPEQGLGDIIQFSRYLPLLKARGLRQLTMVCAPALVRLLRSIDGVDACIPVDEAHRLPPHDYACLLLSLPFRFGTTLENVPASMPYLGVSDALRAQWKSRLPAGGLKVGLVWAGDRRAGQEAARAVDARRSLHASAYAALLRIPGIAFVSLQLGEATRAQIMDLPTAIRPLDPMEKVRDFADTAAIIEQLDLVITVDTSVAHLAGALNKPVWILSRFDGCWRWLADQEESPWYPSARLFKQKTPGGWDEVLERVQAELAAFSVQAR